MTSHITTTSRQKLHGGEIIYCTHTSAANQCEMNFAVFIPPHENRSKNVNIPYLLFLSGLTCTEDNFTVKSGAFKKAAALGLAVLIPDTSPRGKQVADDDAYDLGQGAGFYLNATQAPWKEHFQMERYLMEELLPLAEAEFQLDAEYKAISGHSMGGHGALTLYYKYSNSFQSCSAFAPIVAPSQVAWGEKAFSAYLGSNKDEWKKHDACALVKDAPEHLRNREILIDQGLADNFLEEQLKPELFEQACKQAEQKLTIRKHAGYDHSYFFIQSFIDEHLAFHASMMGIKAQ